MIKVFVTGISSSMVQRMVSHFDKTQFELSGLSRKTSLHLDEIEIVTGDLNNFEAFEQYLENCDLIIHGAAVTHAQNDADYYQTNLEATRKLVAAAKKYNVPKFAFISSNTAGRASGTYGLTKLLAEEFIQQSLSNWIILRPAEVYGDSKKEGIEKLMRDVLEKNVVLCATGIPTKFYPVHADDCGRMMCEDILNPSKQNSICVISGPKGYSFREIIDLTARLSRRKVTVIPLHKSIMKLIKLVVQILPINIGIAPDQIDRLYSVKSIDPSDRPVIKLEDYIKEIAN